jgi:queuosine precursor transporter
MSWRFVISTALGQLIDSGTFVAVAFAGGLPLREMIEVSLTGWAIMVTWEIAALPLTIPLVKALKRTENLDYYDIDTDFNPLHLRMRLTTPGDVDTSNALSRRQIP